MHFLVEADADATRAQVHDHRVQVVPGAADPSARARGTQPERHALLIATVFVELPLASHTQVNLRLGTATAVLHVHRRRMELVAVRATGSDYDAFAGLEGAVRRAVHEADEDQASAARVVGHDTGPEPGLLWLRTDAKADVLVARECFEERLDLRLADHQAAQPSALAIWPGKRIGSNGLRITLSLSRPSRSVGEAVSSTTGMCCVAGLA